MKAAMSSKTFLNTSNIIRHINPEDQSVNLHCLKTSNLIVTELAGKRLNVPNKVT
jgi:hypothetical protein